MFLILKVIRTSQILKSEKSSDNEDSKTIEINLSEKKRYSIFDNFKGILIFMVVFGHFLFEYSNSHMNSLSRKIVVYIYFFHMQAFVFISGFFSSENSTMIKNAAKLLILYYIFNFSVSLILYFYNNTKINFLYPLYSYWYILSLFYWRVTIKYLNNIPFIFEISVVISLLEGYWDCFSNILSIYKTIIFLPYFLAGYKLNQMNILNQLLLWKKSIMKYIVFFIIFCLFSYLVFLYIYKNKITNEIILLLNYNNTNNIKTRIITMIISCIFILLIFLLLPDNKIMFINKWGKNSLYIYLFHRIFTLIAYKELFNKKDNFNNIIEYSILFTLIILFFFGSDILTKFCNSLLNIAHKNLIELNFKGKVISNIFCFSFISLLLIKPISIHMKKNFYHDIQNLQHLTESLINSITISYVGDLILLKDGVIGAYSNETGKYDFKDMFQFTSKYFHSSDLSIGVYEGPSAGNNTSYSTSNYDDKIPLFLNFPDEFAEAVYKSGINLVTTANNHLLDKKIEGAMRTLDILDKYNISHVGSYRNKYEKEEKKIFIKNIKNVKIAILSYTSTMNYYHTDLIYEKYRYLTSIIPKENNKYYKQIYKDVKNDFYKAKKLSPDIIMVLVHMGDEFLHYTTLFQDKWNKIFSDLGADIILGDHSHAIQPIQYIGRTLVVNSPGNFANSYIKNDGDSTAIIRIYIDNQSKKVIGASAIPMYTKELRPKFFSAIPIYDIIYNNSISLSAKEWKRVNDIQKMSTKVLVGKEFGINEAKKEYFFINNSYYDILNFSKDFCNKLNKYFDHEIYKYINNSNSITFIGDSITEGTKNGYHPWFEPMINCFKNKKIKNISKGAYTTKLILKKFKNEIIDSLTDLYIIALGTNDVRYQDSSICSMNPDEYIYNINNIVKLIKNHKSNIIFIAPWFSLPDDYISKLKHFEKKKLMKEYSLKLKDYAEKNNYVYIDPNDYLEKIILTNKETYMIDHIHPNYPIGIELYCESIFIN
jgi:fucose 4-O-acetylase-like acetyltransferase/poly-gamma-glutamate capsule biosynthesis protein CapA/YwtB (metallophosphatase superfamily)/lysophospholipase L1-like esterase